jgi:hypothetical protein
LRRKFKIACFSKQGKEEQSTPKFLASLISQGSITMAKEDIIVGFNYYCEPTFSFLNNLLDTVLLAPIFPWVFNHPWKFTWESTVGLIDKSLLS